MKKYTFTNGDVVTSKLSVYELIKRMGRLDLLIIMTEGYEIGCGASIHNKALKAYNKADNFTGIIRLTNVEKNFICYLMERDGLTDEEKEVINFYAK